MDWCELGDGLQFDDHRIVHEEVSAVANVDRHTVVENRHGKLRHHMATTLSQFVRQAGFIRTLEQPGTECGMHRECGVDEGRDGPRESRKTVPSSCTSAVVRGDCCSL